VLLAGPRVVLGDGRVVAAVYEGLRYRAREEGYHGGCALAEIAIPVVVLLAPGAAALDGWRAAGDQAPPWWSSAAVDEVTVDQSDDALFDLG
jgi:hypothetical protein